MFLFSNTATVCVFITVSAKQEDESDRRWSDFMCLLLQAWRAQKQPRAHSAHLQNVHASQVPVMPLCSPRPTSATDPPPNLCRLFPASGSDSEATPEKRPRTEEKEGSGEEARGTPKQKNRRRCYRCQTKLELVQQELGSCRCGERSHRRFSWCVETYHWGPLPASLPGYVFCMLHRLPEQHDCVFDHLGRGREEAVLKMVKLDRKVGRSCQRIGEECSWLVDPPTRERWGTYKERGGRRKMRGGGMGGPGRGGGYTVRWSGGVLVVTSCIWPGDSGSELDVALFESWFPARSVCWDSAPGQAPQGPRGGGREQWLFSRATFSTACSHSQP